MKHTNHLIIMKYIAIMLGLGILFLFVLPWLSEKTHQSSQPQESVPAVSTGTSITASGKAITSFDYTNDNDPALQDIDDSDVPDISTLTEDEFNKLSINDIKKIVKKYTTSFRDTYLIDNTYQMEESDWYTIRELLHYQLFGAK